MPSKLTKQDLEYISDDMLDPMITQLIEETHFDGLLHGLQGPLEALGSKELFGGFEEGINYFLSRLAEEAFRLGHEHGYGDAALATIDILKQSLAA